MTASCSLFEGLDLLDLWHLYGQIKRAGNVRLVSISKVSRKSRELTREMGLQLPETRGAPDPQLLQSGALLMMRHAYQRWRLERGCPKVLPTFAASVVLRPLAPPLDVLPDTYLSTKAIVDHLQMRRVDLILSSSLDLAGELIQQAESDPRSPFAVVPLFEDPVEMAVNPAHPLAGLRAAAAEDCLAFPSAGYPEGIASRAAEALRARGLWRIACRGDRFDAGEWMLGMRSPVGLCYRALFLNELIPESQELTALAFAEPLVQTNCILMLKEIAELPETQAAVELIRSQVFKLLSRSHYPFNRC